MIGGLWLAAGLAQAQGPALQAVPIERFVEMNGSYAVTLYNLARERFASHERKGEIWIVAVNNYHGERALLKFTEGEFTVVSIPAPRNEQEGTCLYAVHYNNFTLRKADLLALEGKYDKAMQIVRLLKNFDNAYGLEKPDWDGRLELLEKLKQNKDKEKNILRLKEMTINLASSVFELIESKKATVVTNIFEVSTDPFLQ